MWAYRTMSTDFLTSREPFLRSKTLSIYLLDKAKSKYWKQVSISDGKNIVLRLSALWFLHVSWSKYQLVTLFKRLIFCHIGSVLYSKGQADFCPWVIGRKYIYSFWLFILNILLVLDISFNILLWLISLYKELEQNVFCRFWGTLINRINCICTTLPPFLDKKGMVRLANGLGMSVIAFWLNY